MGDVIRVDFGRNELGEELAKRYGEGDPNLERAIRQTCADTIEEFGFTYDLMPPKSLGKTNDEADENSRYLEQAAEDIGNAYFELLRALLLERVARVIVTEKGPR